MITADFSRRDFLKVGGAGLAGAALLGVAGCGGSQGSGGGAEYTLEVADSFPEGHPIVENGAQYFFDRATELTDGRVEFDYYPAEQRGAADELLSLTQSGVVDIGMVSPAYISDVLPLSGVADLPGMHENACDGALAVAELTQEGGILYEEEFASEEVRPLFVGVTPPYDVMTTDTPVRSLEDVEGLQLRSSGGSIDRATEAIGATAVSIAAPEMYGAMQRGTVDGTVIAPMSVPPYQIGELIEYSTVGAQLASFTVTYSISESTWATLPSDIQDALLEAGRDTNRNLCNALNEANETARSDMEEGGTEFYTLSPEEQERWQEALEPVREQWIEDMQSQGLPGQEAIRAMSEAVESVSEE